MHFTLYLIGMLVSLNEPPTPGPSNTSAAWEYAQQAVMREDLYEAERILLNEMQESPLRPWYLLKLADISLMKGSIFESCMRYAHVEKINSTRNSAPCATPVASYRWAYCTNTSTRVGMLSNIKCGSFLAYIY